MNIGTKANSIDDLGKFDGSKMTIKVNGKQIYPQKRYSIVRVDIKCPIGIEEDISEIDRIKMFDCIGKRQCGDCPYGDTKEQLIKKVAQVIYKEKFEWYKKKVMVHTISKIFCINAYDSALQVAKRIVEFLGVE